MFLKHYTVFLWIKTNPQNTVNSWRENFLDLGGKIHDSFWEVFLGFFKIGGDHLRIIKRGIIWENPKKRVFSRAVILFFSAALSFL